MALLYWLQSIRNPVLDAIFSVITRLGEETVLMVVGMLILWCVSKKWGYRFFLVGMVGNTLNQLLKAIFLIPRPWVLDPEFPIVESARAAATGYSFPSGHTQNIVGTMTCVFLSTKEKWIRITAIALIVLVPFSRMYLGVHTPLDVGVAFITALVFAIALFPLVKRADESPRVMTGILLVMLLVNIFYWCYVTFHNFPADIDQHNLHSGVKSAYTLLGCLIGLLGARAIDEKYIRFDVKAVWWAQILKVALGLGVCMGVKSGLKPLLHLFLSEHPATAIRYGLMVFVAGAVWPLTFPWFAKLGKKD